MENDPSKVRFQLRPGPAPVKTQMTHSETASSKTPSLIAVILTVLLLIGLAGISSLFELLALNGASERQGTTALVLSLVCQGIGVILLGMFSGWLTNFLIIKFNWNKILAVITAVLAGIMIGGLVSFLSIILAVAGTGIR